MADSDEITLNVPLLIRLLEFAREEAKGDLVIHRVAEKAVELSGGGVALDMDNYEELVDVENVSDAVSWPVIYDASAQD